MILTVSLASQPGGIRVIDVILNIKTAAFEFAFSVSGLVIIKYN
jgi:hypothetical protein